MLDRRVLRVGAIVWAVVAMTVAVSSVGTANPDARALVGVASVAFPLFAVLAALALDQGRDRVAGALLLLSVATPTYFAWVINVPPFLVGLALLVVPAFTVERRLSRN